MQGVDEVDRLVIAAGVVERLLERIGAEEGEVASLGLQPRGGDESGQLDAFPLPDAAPALDAVMSGDLRARRKAAQFGERELHRALDKATDLKLPIGEAGLAGGDIVGILGIDRAVGLEI